MTESKNTKVSKKSKSGDKHRVSRTKGAHLTKQALDHEYRILLMKDCMIYGKSYDACKLYFESKGLTLGTTNFSDLRNEVKSAKNTKQWFSKEALFVIEEDHMLSVERIRKMEDRLLEEFESVAATNFYKYLNAGTEEQQVVRNKAHDAQLLLRIIAQFQSLQETKTKMFSATPLVQEMMEVHAQHEEEKDIVTTPDKTEKEITT